MTYATQLDLENAFGAAEILHLADRDGDGVAEAAVLNAILARADALIDGYLAGRYAVPVAAPVPMTLVATAGDLARYWLYDDAAPERIREAYEDAIAWLRDVAAGRIGLNLPATGANPLPGSPLGNAESRQFTRETTRGF